jgi:beta-phosphoglucomutase-like phosphatase (HAD superfamily)
VCDIDALIFDLEGTVVDTEPAWDWAQRELLARRGLVYERARVKHLLTGLSATDSIRMLAECYGLTDLLDDLLAERFLLMVTELSRGVRFVDGFEEFFATLPADVKVGVATGMAGELFDVVDAVLGVTELFDGRIFRTDSLGLPSKPAPDIFLHAASELGVAPGRCLVFEDAPNGVRAAHSAGMRCVALATTHTPELLAEADLVISGWGHRHHVVAVTRAA